MNLDYKTDEILKYAIENGNIDLEQVRIEAQMNKRKEILDQHPYSIWKSKCDGMWYTYLPDAQKGRVHRKRKTKTEIEDVIVDYWKKQEENPTIKEVFDGWVKQKVDNGDIKFATRDRLNSTFKRHFQKIQYERIKSFDHNSWEFFLQDEISGHKLYSRAWGNLRAMFRGMITYARRHGWVDYYPNDIIEDLEIGRNTFKQNYKDDEDDSFSLEERWNMIDYISKPENQTIHTLGILLLLVSGLRVGELAVLKYSDINNNIIHVNRTETKYKSDKGNYVYEVDEHPKTRAGDRHVPIPDDYVWIFKAIKRLNPFGEYLFMYRGKRITTMGFRKQMYKLCDILGIKHKSPHKARKTYVSILMENATPDYMVERVVGHTEISTSKQYYLRDIGYHKESEVLNNIPELQKHKSIS